MQHFFQKYDISLSTEQLQGFETFLELFQKTNNQINLSAIRDEEGIITKHFIDSLMLTRFLDEITKNFQPPTSNLQLLDLGTGGGFPGIPLAIYYPNHHFTLLDARKKKCECIKNFVEKLGLENVSVVWGRAEEPEKWELLKNSKFRVQNSEGMDSPILNFVPTSRDGILNYDVVVSRATALLSTLIAWSQPLLKPGGKLIAYKTPSKEEISEAKKPLNTYIYHLENQERTLLEVSL